MSGIFAKVIIIYLVIKAGFIMGSRSILFKIVVVLILLVVVLLQGLSMVQSDRLFERINRLEKQIKTGAVGFRGRAVSEDFENEGDWFVMNFGAEPATLNPITYKDHYSFVVNFEIGKIFETLLDRDLDTLEFEPILAES